MARRRLPVALLVSLLALAALLSACTDAPDRSAEAQRIKQTVEAMPGVESVSMRYENGVLEGELFELKVTMPTATDRQVADVAATIDRMRADRFDAFDQSVTFYVAPVTSVRQPKDLDAADFEHGVALARQLNHRVRAQSTEWAGSVAAGTATVKVYEAVDPSAALDVLLELLGDRHGDLYVTGPDELPDAPTWTVTGAFGPADKERIDAWLAAIPTTPVFMEAKDHALTQLNVVLADPATAYRDLVATIAATGAGPDRPLELLWRWRDDPSAYNEPRWAGSAEIGHCPTTPRSEVLVPDAAALQARIRDEFDSCA